MGDSYLRAGLPQRCRIPRRPFVLVGERHHFVI